MHAQNRIRTLPLTLKSGLKTRVDATFHNEKAHYFGEIPRTQDDHAGSLQGAPPLRVMFWLSRSSASFFPKHINPHISLLRRLQFKSRRAVSAHTRRDALFTLSLTQKLYKSPRHTPDFATIRSRAVRFCRSVPLRRPISPPKFSSATPKFAARFFITDARFPPPDLKNCDRSQIKSQKLRVRAANKQKRLLLPSMPISLKTYRNCEIGGNTPQTQQAVAHHKRRNLTKNRPF